MKMRISDSVANYILDLLNQENGTAEIQRNELASYLGVCPPARSTMCLPRALPRSRGTLSKAGGAEEDISALPACGSPGQI